MGFLNSLHQIRINKKQFNQWEQDNSDKDEQRRALAKIKPLKPDEFEKSKTKGKVIMNVVDIMDTHSEEVAENTETVIMPAAQLAPLASFWASSIAAGKFLMIPALEKSQEAHENFMKNEGAELKKIYEALSDKAIEGVEKLKLRGGVESLFDKKNIEILTNSKEKQLNEYARKITDIKAIRDKIPEIKNFKSKTLIGIGAVAAITLIAFIYSNIKAAKLQVQSSRVARWQSRRELEDPKYFVQYSDEQIKQAKERLEQSPNENEKSFLDIFKRNKPQGASGILQLHKIVKDNKNYEEWKQNYNQEDKKVTRQLSSDELEEAKKDQEVIQRVIKTINNKAEDYSENMETAGGVLISSTPFLGTAIGAIISKIFTKTGIGEKISQHSFNQFLKDIDPKYQDSAKELFETIKNAEKDKKGVVSSLMNSRKFLDEMISNITTNDSQKNIMGYIVGLLKKTKTIINGVLATNKGRGILIALLGTAITGLAGSLIGLKLQKNSARAGRYVAKREIEKDPNSFVGYTDKDYEAVKDVKAQKKSIGKKFVDYITFLPRVIKEYFEYEKYNRTQAKQNKALLGELVKGEVSEEQLKEAKNLQRKLFTTFESVDDNSQEYSESVEAVTEMTSPFVPYAAMGFFAIPLIIGAIKLYKGGVPKAIESITGFLAKHTGLLKKKFVGKYAEDVTKNITNIVKKQEGTSSDVSKLTGMFKDLLDKQSELLPKVNISELKNTIEEQLKSGNIRKILSDLEHNNDKLPDELRSLLNKILRSSVTDEQALKIYQNGCKILENMPKEELNKIIKTMQDEFLNNPDKFMEALQSGKLKSAFATKGVKKVAALTAGGWAAISALFAYVLESSFASLQKRAGRLGVMKALEDLKDPAYYADEEAKIQKQQNLASNKVQSTGSYNSELLEKLIKSRQ